MFNTFYMCMVFTMLSTTSHFRLPADSVGIACDNTESLLMISQEENIDPFVFASLIYHESRFTPKAKSRVGACGLTQVIPKYVPATCHQLQNNTELSIQTGATILSMWLSKKKTYHRALQCYNSGYKCKSKLYADRIIRTASILKKTYTKTKRTMQDALN